MSTMQNTDASEDEVDPRAEASEKAAEAILPDDEKEKQETPKTDEHQNHGVKP